jgi:quercetin dioxygenase-like cupin family protein
VVLAAVIMAIRRRSRSTTYAQGEPGDGRGEGARGYRGDAIQIPLIGHEFRLFGDKFRMLESARETEDESLLAEYFAPPRAKVPEHVQADLEERFEVVSGTLSLRVGGRELILSPGQSAVGPPGVPHEWWNPNDDEEVHFLASIRPALDVETLLETWFGLARDGKAIWWIPKNPLQFAVMAHEVGGGFTSQGYGCRCGRRSSRCWRRSRSPESCWDIGLATQSTAARKPRSRCESRKAWKSPRKVIAKAVAPKRAENT